MQSFYGELDNFIEVYKCFKIYIFFFTVENTWYQIFEFHFTTNVAAHFTVSFLTFHSVFRKLQLEIRIKEIAFTQMIERLQ